LTVCIAAICQQLGEPRIVLCADTKLDAGWAGSSDGNLKIGRLAYGWVGMLSGDWSTAKELHSFLEAEFLASAPFDRTSVFEKVSGAGATFIASPFYRKDKSAEITVCGFIGQTPTIVVLGIGKTKRPHIDFRHTYATSGAGHAISDTFLNVRDCKPQDPLERTIYAVYEAKKYSEKASGVGSETRLTVLAPVPPDAGPEQIMLFNVSPDGFEIL
jgi:hypothetical protein